MARIRSTISGTQTFSSHVRRRQFNVELESKLIKLIFNGQILEDERKSLSQYGLFSEAVVHCLILQKRNTVAPVTSQVPAAQRAASSRIMLSAPNPLEWNGTLYIYVIGMALVSVTLVFCWYCRYVFLPEPLTRPMLFVLSEYNMPTTSVGIRPLD